MRAVHDRLCTDLRSVLLEWRICYVPWFLWTLELGLCMVFDPLLHSITIFVVQFQTNIIVYSLYSPTQTNTWFWPAVQILKRAQVQTTI